MNTVIDTIDSDERGLLLNCAQCGKRNRMGYGALGRTFRCAHCHAELPQPAGPVEIRSAAAFEAVVAGSPIPVLIDFWAPWCGPCKMFAPELAKVAAEGAGRFVVAEVSTEELPEVAQRFGVTAIPTLAVFKGGNEVARQSGAMSARAVHQFIERAG